MFSALSDKQVAMWLQDYRVGATSAVIIELTFNQAPQPGDCLRISFTNP